MNINGHSFHVDDLAEADMGSRFDPFVVRVVEEFDDGVLIEPLYSIAKDPKGTPLVPTGEFRIPYTSPLTNKEDHYNLRPRAVPA